MHKSLVVLALFSASVFAAQSAKADDACNSAGNLVTNCGFETGDFTGWSGTAAADVIFNGVDATDPYSGTYEAYFGPETGNETLSQSLTTVAGATYTISFALHDIYDTSDSNDFSAAFGGTTDFSESSVGNGPYLIKSFTATATSNMTDLSFTMENVDGYFDLDSVSVVQTPEPSSLALLGTGVLGFAGVVRRRFQR